MQQLLDNVGQVPQKSRRLVKGGKNMFNFYFITKGNKKEASAMGSREPLQKRVLHVKLRIKRSTGSPNYIALTLLVL